MVARILSEPDCTGRCRCSHTSGLWSITSRMSSVRSRGCEVSYLTLRIPGTEATDRNSSANDVHGDRSRPYELTFCPSSVTSITPLPTSDSISDISRPEDGSFPSPLHRGPRSTNSSCRTRDSPEPRRVLAGPVRKEANPALPCLYRQIGRAHV